MNHLSTNAKTLCTRHLFSKTVVFSFIVFHFWWTTGYAQQQKIDSIRQKIAIAKEDTTKLTLQNKVSSLESEINPKEALGMAEKNLELAQKTKWPKGIAESYAMLGTIYYRLGQPKNVISVLQKALDINESIHNGAGKYKCLTTLGLAYTDQAEYSKALEIENEALLLSRQAGDKLSESKNLTNIGLVYERLSNYPVSLKYYDQALKINREIKNSKGEALNLTNIGNLYTRFANYKEAAKYFEQALTISQKIGFKYNVAQNLNNLGWMYSYSKDPSDILKSLEYYKDALKQNRVMGSKQNEVINLVNIGDFYNNNKIFDSALVYYKQAYNLSLETGDRQQAALSLESIGRSYMYSKKYKMAIPFLKQSLSVSVPIKDYREARGACECLSTCYESMHQFEPALAAFKHEVIYSDSMMDVAKQKEFTRKEMQFDFDIKDQQTKAEQAKKDLLNADELKRKNFERNIVIIAFILIAIVALFMLFIIRRTNRLNRRLADEKEKSEQLGRLKDKLFSIISHDLRTPFVQIHSLLELQKSEDLPRESKEKFSNELSEALQHNIQMMDNLLNWATSQIRGMAINAKRLNVHALVEENFQVMHGIASKKGIEMEDNTNENLFAMADISTAKLVIRNLIHNAIKFTETGGKVSVYAQKNSDFIKISVQDTGIGMDETLIKSLTGNSVIESKTGTKSEKGFGIGLMLCREFVEKNGGVFEIESKPGFGSIISFTLPQVS